MERQPRNLQEAASDLYEACKRFVNKVESNQARSRSSYAQMKAAIAKADGVASADELPESALHSGFGGFVRGRAASQPWGWSRIKAMSFLGLMVLCLVCGSSALGQQGGVASSSSADASEASAVPRLVNFSGVLNDSNGKPLTGKATLTLSLYAAPEGGSPLWSETQSVQLDDQGHYSLLLGATLPSGLPLDLFTSGEAQWLGVQPQLPGAGEQPRVLLVGMPYALKASDADTLGGLPASAFVQAAASASSAAASSSGQSSNVQPSSQAPSQNSNAPLTLSGGGTTDFLPLWTNSSTLGSSVLFQSGTGSSAKVGFNTTTPATTLDVKGAGTVRGTLTLPATGTATSSGGKNSQPASLQASAFNTNSNTAVSQTFNLQAEPTGNDTATPSGKLNLLFASGTNIPAETGFSIASNGKITFASGQTFPGSGTIAGVTAGTDLTGGGTSGTVTLNLDTTKVPQLAASNTFTGNQNVTGNLTATGVINGGSFTGNGSGLTGVGTVSGVTAGTDLTGGGTSGTVTLNLDTTKVPQLNTANTFTGNQSVTGNVSATGQLISTVPNGTPPLSVNSATLVTGLNATFLDSQPSSAFAQLNGFNLFLGQTTFGNFVTFNAVTTMMLDLDVAGEGTNMIAGNTGCGLGYAGIGFGDLSGCSDYSMAGNGTDTLLNRPTGGYMLFRENNGDEMTIAPGGNVGIGTTAPGAALEVDSSGGVGTPQAYLVQTNSTDYARLRLTNVASPSYWDIAVGSGSSPVMNFFQGGYGNAISLTPGGSVFMSMGNGAYLTAGGAWTNSSDRNLKAHFRPVSGRDVLRRLSVLPITTWNYKTEGSGVRHIGPMAQDFRAAFGLGEDDKHITTIDEGGVALVAIQELDREVSRKSAQIEEQKQQIADLRDQVEKLQRLQDRLAALEGRLALIEASK